MDVWCDNCYMRSNKNLPLVNESSMNTKNLHFLRLQHLQTRAKRIIRIRFWFQNKKKLAIRIRKESKINFFLSSAFQLIPMVVYNSWHQWNMSFSRATSPWKKPFKKVHSVSFGWTHYRNVRRLKLEAISYHFLLSPLEKWFFLPEIKQKFIKKG